MRPSDVHGDGFAHVVPAPYDVAPGLEELHTTTSQVDGDGVVFRETVLCEDSSPGLRKVGDDPVAGDRVAIEHADPDGVSGSETGKASPLLRYRDGYCHGAVEESQV